MRIVTGNGITIRAGT